MKKRTVGVSVVKTKHIYADMFQWIRNQLGMNLVAYETLIDSAIEEAIEKLYAKYPDVQDVHLSTTQVSMGAAEIIAYGTIHVEE